MRALVLLGCLAWGCEVADKKDAPDGTFQFDRDARVGALDGSTGSDAATTDAVPIDGAPDVLAPTEPYAEIECPAEVTRVEGQRAVHQAEGTALAYNHNPPTAGPHYGTWARTGEYRTDLPVPRGNWLHSAEHGWLILLYRPDLAEADIQALRDIVNALPSDGYCANTRWILTPDAELETKVAAVTWNHVLQGDTLTREQVDPMYMACRREAAERRICGEGGWPPAPQPDAGLAIDAGTDGGPDAGMAAEPDAGMQ